MAFNLPENATLDKLAGVPNVDMIGLALAAASGNLAVELANEIVRVSRELFTTISMIMKSR